jgi:hypothetical protein
LIPNDGESGCLSQSDCELYVRIIPLHQRGVVLDVSACESDPLTCMGEHYREYLGTEALDLSCRPLTPSDGKLTMFFIVSSGWVGTNGYISSLTRTDITRLLCSEIRSFLTASTHSNNSQYFCSDCSRFILAEDHVCLFAPQFWKWFKHESSHRIDGGICERTQGTESSAPLIPNDGESKCCTQSDYCELYVRPFHQRGVVLEVAPALISPQYLHGSSH